MTFLKYVERAVFLFISFVGASISEFNLFIAFVPLNIIINFFVHMGKFRITRII